MVDLVVVGRDIVRGSGVTKKSAFSLFAES
jgi:hypothetical protein